MPNLGGYKSFQSSEARERIFLYSRKGLEGKFVFRPQGNYLYDMATITPPIKGLYSSFLMLSIQLCNLPTGPAACVPFLRTNLMGALQHAWYKARICDRVQS